VALYLYFNTGNYTTLYADFNLDIATAAAQATIQNYVAATGTQHQLLAFGVFNSGRMHCYLYPSRTERSLGAPVTALDGKLYAFDGDLFRNNRINANLDDNLFDMRASQIRIQTITTILDALAIDAEP